MMKTTLRDIRNMTKNGGAVDMTRLSFEDIEDIRKREGGFDHLAYAAGVYGCNGKLLRGRKSGILYAVTDRTKALWQVG